MVTPSETVYTNYQFQPFFTQNYQMNYGWLAIHIQEKIALSKTKEGQVEDQRQCIQWLKWDRKVPDTPL